MDSFTIRSGVFQRTGLALAMSCSLAVPTQAQFRGAIIDPPPVVGPPVIMPTVPLTPAIPLTPTFPTSPAFTPSAPMAAPALQSGSSTPAPDPSPDRRAQLRDMLQQSRTDDLTSLPMVEKLDEADAP